MNPRISACSSNKVLTANRLNAIAAAGFFPRVQTASQNTNATLLTDKKLSALLSAKKEIETYFANAIYRFDLEQRDVVDPSPAAYDSENERILSAIGLKIEKAFKDAGYSMEEPKDINEVDRNNAKKNGSLIERNNTIFAGYVVDWMKDVIKHTVHDWFRNSQTFDDKYGKYEEYIKAGLITSNERKTKGTWAMRDSLTRILGTEVRKKIVEQQ